MRFARIPLFFTAAAFAAVLATADRLHLLAPNPARPRAPLAVLLPGMDGSGWLLQDQALKLEPYFDVRCLSLPPDDRSDWPELVQQVVAALRHEIARCGERPTYLIGESFGGCLALKVAAQVPELCDRLVVVNPASAMTRRSWLFWGASATRLLPATVYPLSVLGLVPFLFSLERILPHHRELVLNVLRKVPQETSAWRIELLQRFELSEAELDRLTQPVLGIASEGDRLLPSTDEVRSLVARLPDAKLHLLPDSGHACLLEAAVNLVDIFKAQDFLPRWSPEAARSAG